MCRSSWSTRHACDNWSQPTCRSGWPRSTATSDFLTAPPVEAARQGDREHHQERQRPLIASRADVAAVGSAGVGVAGDAHQRALGAEAAYAGGAVAVVAAGGADGAPARRL